MYYKHDKSSIKTLAIKTALHPFSFKKVHIVSGLATKRTSVKRPTIGPEGEGLLRLIAFLTPSASLCREKKRNDYMTAVWRSFIA